MTGLPLSLDLDELEAQLKALTPEQFKAVADSVPEDLRRWAPQPGPQSDAWFSEADELLYGGAAGGGKGLALDTLLPCPEGFVRMGDVRVGDSLYDADGEPCSVLAVSPVHHRPCFEVAFSDGTVIVADDVHKWVTLTVAERSAQVRRTPVYRAARREMRALTAPEPIKPWLATLNAERVHSLLPPPVPGVRSTVELRNTLRAGGRLNHSVDLCGAVRGPVLALPIDPYVLGCWLGDGSSYKAEITTADAEIVHSFSAVGYPATKRAGRYAYGVGNLLAPLKALGLIANKHVPAAYLRAAPDQRRALLAGLMDTDGYCDTRGLCEFTSTRRVLADGVAELLCSLGVKAVVTEGRATLAGRDCGPKYRVKFAAHFSAFRLPRKAARQKMEISLNARRRYVTAVRPVDSVPTRCIAVSGPSKTYLVGRSFVPTHNSDLLLGLAISKHQRSVIFRAQSVDLQTLWERLQAIVPNPAKQNATTRHMKVSENCIVEMSHLSEPGSERAHMGRARDLLAFDEAAQLAELRVAFVINWARSTDPNQRKRVVFATNPPMPEIKDGRMAETAQGDWLISWFAPWIDDTFPNPAKVGELRWCYMVEEGDRLATIWVPGPGFYDRETRQPVRNATEDDIMSGRVVAARSRTFIKSLVKDNAFLRNTGYAEKLSGTPEPLRSMLLKGDFTIKGADHPLQVIPTQWVLEAQERWKARPWEEVRDLRMLVLAGDIAQGGMDTTVLAPLYETDLFEELITQPGIRTPTGVEVLQMIVAERTDKAIVVLDGQGGWAGSTRDLLKRDQGIDAEMFISSDCDQTWTPNMLYAYYNLRAKMWWEFRLALDPKSGFEICLPPSPRLRTQLTTPLFEVRGKKLIVESKDDIRKRLGGGSTDEADAVLMAWQYRQEGLLSTPDLSYDIVERLNGRVPDPRKGGDALPMDDPRGGW